MPAWRTPVVLRRMESIAAPADTCFPWAASMGFGARSNIQVGRLAIGHRGCPPLNTGRRRKGSSMSLWTPDAARHAARRNEFVADFNLAAEWVTKQ